MHPRECREARVSFTPGEQGRDYGMLILGENLPVSLEPQGDIGLRDTGVHLPDSVPQGYADGGNDGAVRDNRCAHPAAGLVVAL